MADLKNSLKEIMQVPGNEGAALVDVETGMCLAQIGGKRMNLTTTTEKYAHFIRSKEQIIDHLGLEEVIEEVVVTSGTHYHMIYPLKVRILKVRKPENLFFFVALSKNEVTLANARNKIKHVVTQFAL